MEVEVSDDRSHRERVDALLDPLVGGGMRHVHGQHQGGVIRVRQLRPVLVTLRVNTETKSNFDELLWKIMWINYHFY